MEEIDRVRKAKPVVVAHPEDVKRLRDAYDWGDLMELQESRFATKGTLIVFDPAKIKHYDVKLGF